MRSIVLISVKPGTEEDVLATVKETEGVVEAFMLAGIYDLLAIVEAAAGETLKAIIAEKLRKIAGITGTLTLSVVG